ncbi:MAG: YihY/virulence factor BrkB family protein [Actinomycetota bacterium]|nr:YihY/virulence factor BrkB family protein [Actinomycetota bacterium]
MDALSKAGRSVDRFQRRRPWLAFPFAVVKKFGDDQAGNLAALVAYYGFFSLFPLLLVFVTILGMALRGNTALQQRVVDSALAKFPVIGTQISSNVHSLKGSGLALFIGVALTLWAGLGVLKVMQTAMNTVWNVPYRYRPNFVRSTLRAAIMLVVLGVMTLASATAGSVGTGAGTWWSAILGILISLALNLVLFMLAFRILTIENVSWGDVLPGAGIGAVAWTILQAVGGYYVGHELKGASETYGTFATVIGLLAWIYLGAQVTLLAAEVNVVKKQKLWPRALIQPPLTEADERALTRYARQEQRRPEESVDIRIEDQASSRRD